MTAIATVRSVSPAIWTANASVAKISTATAVTNVKRTSTTSQLARAVTVIPLVSLVHFRAVAAYPLANSASVKNGSRVEFVTNARNFSGTCRLIIFKDVKV